jgi:hypothetical protein
MDGERLLNESSDPWQRSLLQAAATESAPDAATAQVLRALEAFPPSVGQGPALSAPALGGKLAVLGEGGALKLAGAVVVAIAIGFCGYWFGLRTRASEVPAPPSVVAAEPRATGRAEQRPVAPVPDDQPLVHRDDVSSAVSAPEPSRARTSRGQHSASAGDALGRELRLLRTARARVQERDAAAALQLLAQYRRAFPRGALQPEAAELERRARELHGPH